MIYSFFISENQIKDYTAIDANVEVEEIRPFVIQAQDTKLQSVLGTDFFVELMTKIDNDTLSDKEKELIKYYIQPLLANYIVYLALPTMTYKLFNKSVLQPSAEEATNIGLDVVKYLRDAYLNTSKFYTDRLVDYLCDNSTDFPTYTTFSQDGMSPMSNHSYNGFYIPNNIHRRPNGYDYPILKNIN